MALILAILAQGAWAQDARQGRTRTVDITASPWSSVVMITNSAYGRCTGVLVAKSTVVTAAHCLFGSRTKRLVRPQSVHVLFGYDRGRTLFHTVAASMVIGEAFEPVVTPASLAADWAVLTLQDPAPEAFPPLEPESARPGMRVVAAGFAEERRELLTITDECTISPTRRGALLVSDCPITQGYSGGPLFDVDSNRPVAIQSAIGQVGGKPLALSLAIDDILREGREEANP